MPASRPAVGSESAGIGGHGGQQLRADRGLVLAAVGVLAAQHGGVFRVPGEMVGQGLADAEDGGQPGTERGVAGELLGQAGFAFGDPRQAGQREVGVGCLGEGGEQRVAVGGDAEGGELAFCARDVGEAHPGQPAR